MKKGHKSQLDEKTREWIKSYNQRKDSNVIGNAMAIDFPGYYPQENINSSAKWD